MTDAIKLYNTKLASLSQNVTEQNLKTFTDFFFTTFMTHYKLYQCVFTTEQDKLFTKMDLLVETPPSPLPFKVAKDIIVWEYEKQIEAIQEKERERKKERDQIRKNMSSEDKEVVQKKTLLVDDAPLPLERQVRFQAGFFENAKKMYLNNIKPLALTRAVHIFLF